MLVCHRTHRGLRRYIGLWGNIRKAHHHVFRRLNFLLCASYQLLRFSRSCCAAPRRSTGIVSPNLLLLSLCHCKRGTTSWAIRLTCSTSGQVGPSMTVFAPASRKPWILAAHTSGGPKAQLA